MSGVLSSAIGAVVAYCIIGGVYMYRVKGARGSEVIPNVAFWKELPLLIKVNTHLSTLVTATIATV